MLKIIYRVCCEKDVHKSFVVVCIASTNEQRVTTYKSKNRSSPSRLGSLPLETRQLLLPARKTGYRTA